MVNEKLVSVTVKKYDMIKLYREICAIEARYEKTGLIVCWRVYVCDAINGWMSIKLHTNNQRLRKRNFYLGYSLDQKRFSKSSETDKLSLYPDLLQKLTEVIEEYIHA